MKNIKKVVLPVAGLGTRFLPATKASPKEMLPIVDKPLIQYAAEEAVASGINQLVFVIGRTKNAIINHFNSAPELENELMQKNKTALLKIIQRIVPKNVDCIFVRQNKPAGLGHAIYCARNIVKDEPFAVMLADDLIKSKVPCLKQMIKEFLKTKSSIIALENIEKKDSEKYGIVNYSSKKNNLYEINSIVEKPKPKDATSNLGVVGRYILLPSIFKELGKSKLGAGNEIQLTDGIAQLINTQKVYGYSFSGKRFDCGSKIGYLKATIEYALEHNEVKLDFKRYLKNKNFK